MRRKIPEFVTYVIPTSKGSTYSYCSPGNDSARLARCQKWLAHANPQTITIKNEPISNIRLVIPTDKKIEELKVIVDDKYNFILSLDILRDAIKNCTISNGYIQNEQYIWSTEECGSLIRIGSEEHKKMVENDRLLDKGVCSQEIGDVFKDSGNYLVYTGRHKITIKKSKWNANSRQYDYFSVTENLHMYLHVKDDLQTINLYDLISNKNRLKLYQKVGHITLPVDWKKQIVNRNYSQIIGIE